MFRYLFAGTGSRSQRAHRNEFSAGYSLASCTPALLAAALPALIILHQSTLFADIISANGKPSPFGLYQPKGPLHGLRSLLWGELVNFSQRGGYPPVPAFPWERGRKNSSTAFRASFCLLCCSRNVIPHCRFLKDRSRAEWVLRVLSYGTNLLQEGFYYYYRMVYRFSVNNVNRGVPFSVDKFMLDNGFPHRLWFNA